MERDPANAEHDSSDSNWLFSRLLRERYPDGCLGGSLILVDLKVSPGVRFGQTMLEIDDQLIYREENTESPARVLTPVHSVPLAGPKARIQVSAGRNHFYFGLEPGGREDKIALSETCRGRHLHLSFMPGEQRYLLLDRLGTRSWERCIPPSCESEINVGHPATDSITFECLGRPAPDIDPWTVAEWVEEECPEDRRGFLAPRDPDGWTRFAAPWRGLLRLPMVWFDGMRRSAPENLPPSFWFRIPWPENAQEAADSLDNAFRLNSAIYADRVLSKIQSTSARREGQYMMLPRSPDIPGDQHVQVLCAWDRETYELHQEIPLTWWRRSHHLEVEPFETGEGDVARVRIPTNRNWTVFATYLPKEPFPFIPRSGVQMDTSRQTRHLTKGRIAGDHAVVRHHCSTRPAFEQLTRYFLGGRSVARKHEFLAALRGFPLFDLGKRMLLKRIEFRPCEGIVRGVPICFLEIKIPVVLGELSPLDLETGNHVLEAYLEALTELNTRIRVVLDEAESAMVSA